MNLILVMVLFAAFWLLLVRPQQRRARIQRELLRSVEAGDEIVSTGGIYGVIKSIEGDELQVQIADGLVVRMARGAVAGIVEPEDDLDDESGADEAERPPDGVEAPPPS